MRQERQNLWQRRATVASSAGLALALGGLFIGSFALGASPAQATIERVSRAAGGAAPDAPSFNARTNGDGSQIVFLSAASNLVADDHNGHADVFVLDRNSGNIERVSLSFLGGDPNDNSFPAVLSSDGRFVAFGSAAANLVRGDFNTLPDVFLFDRESRATVVLSLAQDGLGGGAIPDLPPAISADGRFVVFASQADNLIDNDANQVSDVFVFDRNSGGLEALTLTSLGSSETTTANGASAGPAISDDGCLVAFYSDASNLVPQDTNSARDVFVRNRCTGDIERASVNSQGEPADGPSETGGGAPGISADGRFVVFFSNARNLDPADGSGNRNIYIRDRADGTTRLVSLGMNGEPANGASQTPSVSADGRFVAFQSLASNLVGDDTNGRVDVFVADVTTGEIRLVSVTENGTSANGDSSTPQISNDGGSIVFQSSGQLTSDDTDNLVDVYRATNPLRSGPPEPTPTATATESGVSETATPTETASNGEGTPTPTPQQTFNDTTPTFTRTPTDIGGGTRTPTRTIPGGSPTRTPTQSAGGGGGGGGGGCGCRIDPATGGIVADSPLPALLLPVGLWILRRTRRFRME